ncbi:hypothetical protein LRS10_22545 [Phenylobacterium sp. J426]|uniref:hypothetical protein n=1 Tax=Phenylobacterium sp. J426 TaxID=2898439 RepID=UPI002151BA4B|nr:hypothetical protein [Phenylobacterium sp. J426]MCR5876689.1 hypothetical protein [Phenylobacterium sp. J426]
MTLRYPGEVAASLAARNGFSPEKGWLLWAAYTVAAEAGVEDALVVRAFYDQRVTAPAATIELVDTGLGLVEP